MPTILVVEDEQHLRATLAYNLRKAGYAVETAATGSAALAAFHAGAPDLLLLDVMLPEIDGFEICRRIRQTSSVPILMLTTPATGRSLRAVITTLPAADEQPALVVLQDLTELRRAEWARRAFLANISHDLRTPLASLQAMIETLQDGAIDDRPDALDFLARMDAEVHSLNRLVAEFLELSRIETGELELHLAPTNLRALLLEVVARMAAQSRQRGVILEPRLPERLPTLAIDGERIAQVLLNLLQNALAFTPAGGTITLSAVVEEDQVVVTVRDTGVGIAAEDLAHIFERFYKGDRARSGGGTGLGLAIAKHLVERHGGQIAAASEHGQGTTITIALPRSAPARARTC
ncbi:MAG: response regulator [Kouleothrix sp.]|nr:response regulator [Kouleothrix sp.]